MPNILPVFILYLVILNEGFDEVKEKFNVLARSRGHHFYRFVTCKAFQMPSLRKSQIGRLKTEAFPLQVALRYKCLSMKRIIVSSQDRRQSRRPYHILTLWPNLPTPDLEPRRGFSYCDLA